VASATVVNIEFSGRQVSVATDLLIAKRLRRRFTLMIGDCDSNVVARFEIQREESAYRLIEDTVPVAVEHNIEDLIETLVHKIAERFIEAFSSLLWFHAAVVAKNERAIMLPAMWGHGKSSLAVALANEGWTYLSDDLAPLDPGPNSVIPYPRTPTVRSHCGHELPRERISELPKTEALSRGWSTAVHPVPLHSVVFPKYQFRGGCKLLECKPEEAVVELLGHCLNFSDNGSIAVAHLAKLMPEIKSYQLPFGDATMAASVVTTAFQMPRSQVTGNSR
jgi:hypothetical protein